MKMLEFIHIVLSILLAFVWYLRSGSGLWRIPVGIFLAYLGIYIAGLMLYILVLIGAMIISGLSMLF